MSQNFHRFIDMWSNNPNISTEDLVDMARREFEDDFKIPSENKRNVLIRSCDIFSVHHSTNLGTTKEHTAMVSLYSDYLDVLFKVTTERMRQYAVDHQLTISPMVDQSPTPTYWARGNDSLIKRDITPLELISKLAVENFEDMIRRTRQQYEYYLQKPLEYIVIGISQCLFRNPVTGICYFAYVLNTTAYRFTDETRQNAIAVQDLEEHFATFAQVHQSHE